MEEWLDQSKAFNYADDTSSSCKGKNIEEVKTKLETDAQNLLEFMASNGLVANASKTVLMILNNKAKLAENKLSIKVGQTEIEPEANTKLLGVKIEENQKWNTQCKDMVRALNARLFQIRRIKNQIPKQCQMKIVQSLWFSKLRYGIALFANTRTKAEDPITCNMRELQCAQNRLLRLLEGCRIKDRISTESLLKKYKLPSVNQVACEVKLMEVWKSINVEDYPTQLETGPRSENPRSLRTSSLRQFDTACKTKTGENSFQVSAAKLWNSAPAAIKSAKSPYAAKKAIKQYCSGLPI